MSQVIDAKPVVDAVLVEFPALRLFPWTVVVALSALANRMYQEPGAGLDEVVAELASERGVVAIAGTAWGFLLGGDRNSDAMARGEA